MSIAVPGRAAPRKAPGRSAVEKSDAAAEFESDFLWGAEAIACYLGLTLPQFYYLFAAGKFKGAARKMGHRTITASKRKLDALIS
jgi:hypothetical protein